MQGCKFDSREWYSKALHSTEQSCKHLLLVDGGSSEQCYRYLESVERQMDESLRRKETKPARETCNAIVIIQHPGEEPYSDVAFFRG